MSKQKLKVSKSVRFGKSDFRFWKSRLFKNSYTRDGVSHSQADYSVKIQFDGKRETFNLNISNKDLASKKAVKIYQSLLNEGMDKTCEIYKSQTEKIISPTVGEFIREFESQNEVSKTSLISYAGKFRRLVAEICKINSDKSKYHSGAGSRIYREKVESVKLSKITSYDINSWKRKFVGSAKNEEELRSKKVTVNSIIRNSKSLFAPKALVFVASDFMGSNSVSTKTGIKRLQGRLSVPCNPFEGVELETVHKQQYDATRDGMNAELIFASARNELEKDYPEQYKIFLLAITAGLRRKEIDWIKWNNIDFAKGEISVRSSIYYALKTSDSEAVISIDKDTSELLKMFKKKSTSEYVITSARTDSLPKEVSDYRCSSHYTKLIKWLRGKGVVARQPLHTLRKEAISIIAKNQGIHIASAFARHSDIRMTADIYAEPRVRAEVDTSALLGGELNIKKTA